MGQLTRCETAEMRCALHADRTGIRHDDHPWLVGVVCVAACGRVLWCTHFVVYVCVCAIRCPLYGHGQGRHRGAKVGVPGRRAMHA